MPHLRIAGPIVLLAAALAGAAGCNSIARDMGPEYIATIRVESAASGGGIKLNGMPATLLPGYVNVEVDATGKVSRQYVITLSTNILGSGTGAPPSGDVQEIGRFTLDPGQGVPAKVYFGEKGTSATGIAAVTKMR